MEELIQTVAILGAALVFMAKISVDAYRRRSNGGDNPDCRGQELSIELQHLADRIGTQFQQALSEVEKGRHSRELEELLRDLIRDQKALFAAQRELIDKWKTLPCQKRES